MMKQIINGEEFDGDNALFAQTQEQIEGEAIMRVAAMREQQNTGRQLWETAKITLTDENCQDDDVESHAEWLLREQSKYDNSRIRIIDRRTK